MAQNPQSSPSFNGQGAPMPPQQQQNPLLGSPMQNNSFRSPPQGNSFSSPTKANSFCSSPNQNETYGSPSRSSSITMQAQVPQQTQSQGPQVGCAPSNIAMNPLEQMQQYVQQMQSSGGAPQQQVQRPMNNNLGLSQTIHGQPMSGSMSMNNNLGLSQTIHGQPMPGPMGMSNNSSLNQTVHGQPFRRSSNPVMLQAMSQSLSQSMHDQRRSSFHSPSDLNPPFSGGVVNGSIASEAQPKKGQNGGPPINNAMEKLCESMKRSAMSRSLIKQYSSSARGSVAKQNSFRGQLPRQNSGRMMIKQMSNRGLMTQTSNRSVVDDGSGRGTPTGPGVPVRRIANTKHHLQPPERGIYRHNSQPSLNGQSNHNINIKFN